MRQITSNAINAFDNNRNFSQSNTAVAVIGERTKLLLHGNVIAEKIGSKLFISSCGWNTVTTKERLNAIDGVSIYQKDFSWFLNGKPWTGERIEIK